MPAVSVAQQRLLYARFGSAWVHAHGFNVLRPDAPLRVRSRTRMAHRARGGR